MYKLECNTCRCTRNQALMCTKMACIDWKRFQNLHQEKKALRGSNKKQKLQLEEKRTEVQYLPKLQKGVLCKPGKIYRSDCKRCFCTDENKVMCSKKKEACTFDKFGYPPPINAPEDIGTTLQVADLHESLSSASEKCEPGKSYRVDCNHCVCLESFNLLCDKNLCISYDDMNRLAIKDMSGKPCNENETVNCRKCDCIDGITQCSEVPDCEMENRILLKLKDEPKPLLDAKNDKCTPHTIYKSNCNKCYCQDDGSLRCTQKTCLNYSQVKILEKQRKYLEKYGL